MLAKQLKMTLYNVTVPGQTLVERNPMIQKNEAKTGESSSSCPLPAIDLSVRRHCKLLRLHLADSGAPRPSLEPSKEFTERELDTRVEPPPTQTTKT